MTRKLPFQGDREREWNQLLPWKVPKRGIWMFSEKNRLDNWDLFLEGPKKFSHPKSRSKNLKPYDYRAVLYMHIFLIWREVLFIQEVSSGFSRLKSIWGFQEMGSRSYEWVAKTHDCLKISSVICDWDKITCSRMAGNRILITCCMRGVKRFLDQQICP